MARKPSRSSIGSLRSPHTHKAIIISAIETLKECGYSGLSIEAVARRAGASKPTIYRWWGNKAALIAEVYESESEQIRKEPDKGSFKENLNFLLLNLWKVWRETICGEAFRCVIAEAQLDPSTLPKLKDEFMERRRELPRKLVEKAIQQGELPKDTSRELLLDMIFGFCWYRLLTEQLEVEADINEFTTLLMNGVLRPTSTAVQDAAEA
ncbi:TetR/AcrR family transcriptional regulator [Pseudomonas brassicacearum]|uniref:TetR/AcrR family transcriptional regulator n=1 Tax=Pseudomonas TaxID=286 RepID=UPI00070DC0BB|nr:MULTISPECIES: TetR/AcrR family transcriptional regulator [Pseudomonas]KQW41626.1 transcriptional regulator [Pseudomonas sp. Root401]WHS56990.1 TetR/AcrR family transcriptional regulator [Pseudomonas brassicacearum]